MRKIPLTQGKFALVDDSDYAALSCHKWYTGQTASCNVYAKRKFVKPGGGRTDLYMHRQLFPSAAEVAHRDGDGLNNQRENLVPMTHQQNLWGSRRKKLGASSKYRGVCWVSADKKWKAQIRCNGKLIYLGQFDSEDNAARAYDDAATKLFGEFASPNFKQQKPKTKRKTKNEGVL